MDIVTIFGGPRLRGNTATVLGWVEDALRDGGHSVRRFNTAELTVNACRSCHACAGSMEEPGCVQQDDAPKVFEAMIGAGSIVFASPLYMWSISAQLKPLLDRTLCLVRGYGGPEHTSFIEGKKGTLLMTCMGPIEGNTEWARGQFTAYANYQKLDLIEPWIVPGCSAPEQLGDDVAQMAAELAARLVG